MNITSFVTALVSTLQTSILPGLASITVTPGMTVPQLTAELESDVVAIVTKKYGPLVADILILVPAAKQQLDKAISYVSSKALPVLESPTFTEVVTGAEILAASAAPTPAIPALPATPAVNAAAG